MTTLLIRKNTEERIIRAISQKIYQTNPIYTYIIHNP